MKKKSKSQIIPFTVVSKNQTKTLGILLAAGDFWKLVVSFGLTDVMKIN